MNLKLFCTPLRENYFEHLKSQIENRNINFSKYISKINILQEEFDSFK
jgi:hypothetical protein